MSTLVQAGYLPQLWEFLVIAGVTGLMILMGVIVQRRLAGGPGLPLPFPAALALFIAMFAGFCVLIYIFVLALPVETRMDLQARIPDPVAAAAARPPQNRQLDLFLWCLIGYSPAFFYYIGLLRNSYATRIVDRIGPLSARIEDPSEFASARKLALRGDVDGAVAMYLSYKDNACEAMFEAARLLKSEDRFAEAAAIFQDITTRFQERRSAWAEAAYHLAKIQEQNLRDHTGATALYMAIVTRAPESRFALQAQSDLRRLQTGEDEEVLPELVEVPKAGAERDPFFGKGRTATQRTPEKKSASRRAAAADNGRSDEDGVEVPPQDPFMKLRAKQRAAALGQAAPEQAKKATSSKKPVAAKKPAAAAAAPAKKAAAKKPAAKKPAAKKKPSA